MLERAGVKTVIHGPFTFAPDGNPLVGPVPGMRGYWSACAVMAGFSQGGGVGKALSEWMVHGEPENDVFAMDVARFGDWTGPDWTRLKVTENYQRRFSISYPNEELPVGRPLETTPAYGMWDAQRAVFGSGYGMEHVNYFAPEGEPRFEEPSFRRSNAHDAVGRGMPRGARGGGHQRNPQLRQVPGRPVRMRLHWLNRIMANRVPDVGRMALTAMLSPKGKIIGDFTMMRLAEDTRAADRQLQRASVPHALVPAHQEPGVTIGNISKTRLGFQIAGPNARAVLTAATGADCQRAGDAVPVGARHGHRSLSRSPSRGSAIPAIWGTRSTATATIRSRCIRRWQRRARIMA